MTRLFAADDVDVVVFIQRLSHEIDTHWLLLFTVIITVITRKICSARHSSIPAPEFSHVGLYFKLIGPFLMTDPHTSTPKTLAVRR